MGTVAAERASCTPPDRFVLQWHLTERCNLQCTHCYQERRESPELNWPQWLIVLEQYKSLLSLLRASRPIPAQITVTGGEPLVHPDFPKLLQTVAKNPQWSFAILTNGTLIDASVARFLAELKPAYVQVSIEGSQSTHDSIRGQGSFAAAVAGIRQLVARHIPTLISFTAHQSNYRDFPQVAELGRQLGVQRVWADRMIPLGSGASFKQQLLTPQQTLELFELMMQSRQALRRGRTEIALHRSLQFIVAGGPPYRCSAGHSLLALLPNGDLCPCRRMPSIIGNVLQQPLHELYFGSPLLASLRDASGVSRGCQKCFYRQLCGGGSRCLACAVHGDPFHADPGCWLARPPDTPADDSDLCTVDAGCL